MKTTNHTVQFILMIMVGCYSTTFAQQKTDGWLLDKMPADLETQYALSALPPYLRDGATVYLLDPAKGYYISRKGTNGFSAYVNRTEWERAEFVQDTYAALGFDAEGAKTLLPIFLDIGNMRATGKYSPAQIRDSVVKRVKDGRYHAPARSGICYMLSPVHRGRLADVGIVNMVMPHYMFYAPYVDDNDIGGKWGVGGHQPFIGSVGAVLDKAHSIFNYIILAAGEAEKSKIVENSQDLMQKLAAYKPSLKVETKEMVMDHH